MDESGKLPLTAVDRIADGNGLQMMKAAIPYLPGSIQKSLSLYVKLAELQNVISYYQHSVSACSPSTEPHTAEEILTDLRNYGTDSQRQSLDQTLNLLNTLKMYQDYKDLL